MVYEEGEICQITCHPHIMGSRSRSGIIEQLIKHTKSTSDVRFAPRAETSASAKAHVQ